MIGLFLDTSSKYLIIALTKDKKIIDIYNKKLDNDLSQFTLYQIQQMLNKNNIKPIDIEEIYCVNGPGSFTGIRIGVTIAKTYAWVQKIKIMPVSSLQVIATTPNNYDYKIPVIDARRGYVYAGIYDKSNNLIMEDQYISLNDLLEKAKELDGSYTLVSRDKFNDLYVTDCQIDLNSLLATINNQLVDAHSFSPNYLKQTEAEENLNKHD